MKKDVEVELTTVVELDRLHARPASTEASAGRLRATGTLEPQSIDRFAILRVIARGGMGELYLGWDDRLDRKVAIKLIHT